MQPHNLSFSASTGWVDKFFSRHKVLTPVTLKLPKHLEGAPITFYADAAKFMSIGKRCFYLLVIWIKYQCFLTWCHHKKYERECVVRSSGSEKKHLTVVLSAAADELMIPPTIVFRGKTYKTICNLNIPPTFIVKTEEKVSMDHDLMKVWVEEIWLKHTKAECKKLGSQKSML